MNINKIESLLKQIEESEVMLVDDSPYLHCCYSGEVWNEENHTVLYFKWTDEEAQEYMVEFTEKSVDEAVIKNNTISLKDVFGDDSTIYLYNLAPNPIVSTR